jgi:hypothetical protein
VKAGFMTNIHPTATTLINPEMAGPKVKIANSRSEKVPKELKPLNNIIELY